MRIRPATTDDVAAMAKVRGDRWHCEQLVEVHHQPEQCKLALATATKPTDNMTFNRRPGKYMNDTSSIESVIHAFYEVISGLAGEKRNWERLRSLFAPGASLVPSSVVCGTSPPSAIDIEAYIQRLAGFLSQHDFFETGFVHRIEVYGNIASVISTYEARHTPNDPEPSRRGVNFIQMLSDGNRWWLTSMIWRDENKNHAIPERYRRPADVPWRKDGLLVLCGLSKAVVRRA